MMLLKKCWECKMNQLLDQAKTIIEEQDILELALKKDDYKLNNMIMWNRNESVSKLRKEFSIHLDKISHSDELLKDFISCFKIT